MIKNKPIPFEYQFPIEKAENTKDKDSNFKEEMENIKFNVERKTECYIFQRLRKLDITTAI